MHSWCNARRRFLASCSRAEQIDVVDRQPNQLLEWITVIEAGGIVGVEDLTAVRVDQQHHRGVAFEEIAEAFFALLQRLLQCGQTLDQLPVQLKRITHQDTPTEKNFSILTRDSQTFKIS